MSEETIKTIFFYEIYTKNPETGECGWDIEIGTIRNAANREDANEKLKRHFVHFDCLIQLHAVSPPINFGGVHLDASI